MASAIKTVTQVATTTYMDKEVIRLELSKDEAETLRIVLGMVGGDPHRTPRGLIDGIRVALTTAGVRWPNDDYALFTDRPWSGSITFKE